MRYSWLIGLVLSACTTAGGPGLVGAVNPRGQAEDGLLVGHRLMEAGEYELALKSYYRAASEKGMTVDVMASIGSANMRLGRLGQAETLLRRAIELDGSYVPALNNLGVVLMETGEIAEAKEMFEQAYAQDSGETDSIRENLNRAIAAANRPQYNEAEDAPVLYDLINGTEGQNEETLNSL
jgi:Flp pilus assembly protein TadD